MRIKICIGVTAFIFLVLLCFGLYEKRTYRDFNDETAPLENFQVGLLTDAFLDGQLENMKNNLSSCNIIVAVKCIENMEFRFGCTTQKVELDYIFKGDGLNVGDTIDVARYNSTVFLDEDTDTESPYINMGFVNEMIPGEYYLVFLDRKINTFDEQKIYIQSDDFIMAPIFSYAYISNTVCISESEDSASASYLSVKDNEFFIMSEAAIEKLEAFKDELLSYYKYDQ